MRLREAKQLCPQLIVRSSRPKRYADCSAKIMSSLEAITPGIEVFSINEAFLDVAHCQSLWGSPEKIGLKVKYLVKSVSQLPCSVGVSGDKFTEKFAGNIQKPNGFTFIHPDNAREYLVPFLVTELCGIGNRTGIFLEKYGVKTRGDM